MELKYDDNSKGSGTQHKGGSRSKALEVWYSKTTASVKFVNNNIDKIIIIIIIINITIIIIIIIIVIPGLQDYVMPMKVYCRHVFFSQKSI